jgi:hypothetical protein
VLSGGAVARVNALQAQGTGDHRLDPADRGGPRLRATSACCRSTP